MGSFRKPKSNTYKRFLYIDENDVLNSLSAMEGGAIEEILQNIAKESSSGLGGDLGVDVPGAFSVKGKGGKEKSRRIEEEIRRKRTVHSAAVALINKLHEDDAVGVIEGNYSPEIYEQLEENMPIQFEAEIRIHPLHQLVSFTQGWAQLAEDFGLSKREVNEFTRVARQIESAFHGKNKDKQVLAIFAETEGITDSQYKLVLPIQTRHLLVPLDEFSGRATFVAQVDRILDDGEELLAARMVRNSPVLPAERTMMVEMLPALKELQSDEIGLRIDEEDIVLRKPSVILKPLCIYR